MGGDKRGAEGPVKLGYLSGVYHVASLLRVTTEWSHSVVTAISMRHRPVYGRAQQLKATRTTPYPAFFIVVVVDLAAVVVVVAVPLARVLVVVG